MRTRTARTWMLLILCVMLLPGVPGAAGDDAIPPEVAGHAQEWPLAHQSYSNARNAVSTITSGNVADLKPAWSFAIPGTSLWGAAATTPLIIDGVVYFQDLASNVYALDFASGNVLWQHDYNALNQGPNGVAVGWGKVFAPVAPSFVVALDAKTGSELWRTQLSDNPDDEGIDIQPIPYANKVLVSTVPNSGVDSYYEGGSRGVIMALDQQTGAVEWQFDTVDSADLWGNPDINSGGGVWYPPAIDVESGLTYWEIANPAPYPGTGRFPNGSSRPGPNLYTNSLVALGLNDGALAWYQQVKPHDLFDLDFQLSPILTRANVGGASHDMVIAGGKSGVVYAFDRASGEQLWSASVGRHQNDLLSEIPRGKRITVYPGTDGGIETPMALADDGTVYAATLNLPTDYTNSRIFYDELDYTAGTSEFVAIDVRSGAILWITPFEDLLLGGATVSNDLVFTASYEGTLYALDHLSGEILWQYKAPGGVNGWPAIVGDTVVWPTGMGPTPTLLALRLSADGAAS